MESCHCFFLPGLPTFVSATLVLLCFHRSNNKESSNIENSTIDKSNNKNTVTLMSKIRCGDASSFIDDDDTTRESGDYINCTHDNNNNNNTNNKHVRRQQTLTTTNNNNNKFPISSSKFYSPNRLTLKIPFSGKTKERVKAARAAAFLLVEGGTELDETTTGTTPNALPVDKRPILESTAFGNSTSEYYEDAPSASNCVGETSPTWKPRNRFKLFARIDKATAARHMNQLQHFQEENQLIHPGNMSSSDAWLDSMIPLQQRSERSSDGLTWAFDKGFAISNHQASCQAELKHEHASDSTQTFGVPIGGVDLTETSHFSSVTSSSLDDTWAEATVTSKTKTKTIEETKSPPVDFATLATGFWISKEKFVMAPKHHFPLARRGRPKFSLLKNEDDEPQGVSVRAIQRKISSLSKTELTPYSKTTTPETTETTLTGRSVSRTLPHDQSLVGCRRMQPTFYGSGFLGQEGATMENLLRDLSWSCSSESMSRCLDESISETDWNDNLASSIASMKVFVSKYCDDKSDGEEPEHGQQQLGSEDTPFFATGGGIRVDVLSDKNQQGQVQDEVESVNQQAPDESKAELKNLNHGNKNSNKNRRPSLALVRKPEVHSSQHRLSTHALDGKGPACCNRHPEVVIPKKQQQQLAESGSGHRVNEDDTCSAITEPDYGISDEYSFAGSDYSAPTLGFFLFMDVE